MEPMIGNALTSKITQLFFNFNSQSTSRPWFWLSFLSDMSCFFSGRKPWYAHSNSLESAVEVVAEFCCLRVCCKPEVSKGDSYNIGMQQQDVSEKNKLESKTLRNIFLSLHKFHTFFVKMQEEKNAIVYQSDYRVYIFP